MKKLSLKWHIARRALSLSKYLVAGAAVLAMGQAAFAQDAKIQVVAAENFYGDVVHQLKIRICSKPARKPRAPCNMQILWSTTAPTTIRGWRNC
jgi:hypothetical protein